MACLRISPGQQSRLNQRGAVVRERTCPARRPLVPPLGGGAMTGRGLRGGDLFPVGGAVGEKTNGEEARRTSKRLLVSHTGARVARPRRPAMERGKELKGLQADGGKAPGRDRRFRCGTAGQVVDGHLTLDGRERGL